MRGYVRSPASVALWALPIVPSNKAPESLGRRMSHPARHMASPSLLTLSYPPTSGRLDGMISEAEL